MENPSRTEAVSDPTLAAELEAIRSQLRDYEKALVERIADVDDDRRGTANKLQRAWATHSEEVDARLRRQGALLTAGMTLFVILAAIALLLVYLKMDSARQPLAAGLAEVKKELGMISEVATQDDRMRRQITQLSAAVGGISSSLERLDAGPGADMEAAFTDERAARDEAVSRLSGEIERLERAQAKLAEEAKSLRAAVAAAKMETAAALAAVRNESAGALAAASAATEAAVSFGRALEERTRRPSSGGPVANAKPETLEETLSSTAPGQAAPASEQPKPAETHEPAATAPTPEPVQSEPPDAAPPSAADAPPAESAQGEAAGAQGSTGEGAEAGGTALEESPAAEVTVTGDDTYALQLMGFYSFQDLVDYAARVDLPDRVYYREETYRGRPWFVLIHSLHPSLAAATEERSRLPPRLAGLDIWVRPLREGMQLQVLGTSGGR